MRNDLKSLFFQGSYKEVLAHSIEPAGHDSDVLGANSQWVIGALCFMGRKEEADALFLEFQNSADALSLAACRFFLGVAFCRHGHTSKSCGYFADNLRTHRNTSGEAGFFAWQGLAFYRYFCADFKKSEKAALKSLTHATVSQFTYARALALDIIGHSLAQQGQVSAGLFRLADAKKSADSLGNGGLSKAIDISSLVYIAQYGLAPGTIIRDLVRARKNLDPQNSYTQSNLLLELANQYLLRGKIESALTALNEASTLIYGSQHRRYAHLLALRFAEVAYRKGEFASALHAVQMQRSQLDEKYDRVNLLMALGLEVKLLKALAMEPQMRVLTPRLTRLTEQTSRAISKNILSRERATKTSEDAEDRIEKLFLALKAPDAAHATIRSGYKSFIYEALNLRIGTSWIVASRTDLLILDKGEVTHHRFGVPAQLLRLIAALADGQPRQKEELIRLLWGYAYHPLHHDPLLYQAVARLREVLGNYGHLIEVSDEGYRLRRGFGFQLLHENRDPASTDSPPLSTESRKSIKSEYFTKDLNERQIRILDLLRKQRFLAVRDCLRRFGVSDMTLKRDFSGLVKGGWVHRVGRARATHYTLQKTPDSTTVRSELRD